MSSFLIFEANALAYSHISQRKKLIDFLRGKLPLSAGQLPAEESSLFEIPEIPNYFSKRSRE